MTPNRRSLTFRDFDAVTSDVDRLLETGYDALGHWSLGQICNHLTWTVTSSVEGFPSQFPWLVRQTIGQVVRSRVLGTGRMPERVFLPARLHPLPNREDRAEAEALRAALRLYQASNAPRALHPIMGRISPQEWDRLHLIHSAHHLSFLVPKPRIEAAPVGAP